MQLAYQYRLKPTKEQKHTLNEWVELCRRQYNYRLAERFRWWETTRTLVNACPLNCSIVPVQEIYKNIPEFRVQTRDGRAKDENGKPKTKKGDKHPNIEGGYVRWDLVQKADQKNTKKLFPEYKKLHSQVLQDVINRVEYALSRFIYPDKNGNRSGKPRFKGKAYYKSFTYSQFRNENIVKDKNGRDCLELSGIGLIPVVFHRPIPAGFKVKTATIKRHADGWYVSLTLEEKSVPDKAGEEIHPTEENSIGIDLGLERFLTKDDGSFIEIPQFLRKSSDKLTHLQQKRDKHYVGSYPRRRLNKKIAKLHQRIKRQRLQFHFEQAILLLKDTDVVFVEELSLKNMIRRNKPKQLALSVVEGNQNGEYLPNGQAAKSGLNKSFVDAAHGQFVRILEWVAWKLGKRVVKIDPWGTSQHCSQCFEKVPKELKDRWHSCPSCGLSLHRDRNSARLIKLVGLGVASLKNVQKERKPTLPKKGSVGCVTVA